MKPDETVYAGALRLLPTSDTMSVAYRHGGGAFQNLIPPKGVVLPEERVLQGGLGTPLKPGEERQSGMMFSWNREKKDILFDEPGDYEFVAIYHHGPTDGNWETRSNVLIAHVDAPPASMRPELEEYRPIARLLNQYPWSAARSTARNPNMVDFLARHPQGVYSRYVRRLALTSFAALVVEGDATPEEKQSYRKLQDESDGVE